MNHGGMWGSEGIAPLIIKHGTSLKLLVRFTTPRPYPGTRASAVGAWTA